MEGNLTVKKLLSAKGLLMRNEKIPIGPTFLSKSIFDAAKAKGLDMAGYAISSTTPIAKKGQ